MVLKGLPDDYKAFVAVTTLTENVDDFSRFKISLRHFEETESSRSQSGSDQNSSVMKTVNARNGSKPIVCYSCGAPGHKSPDGEKKKGCWCNNCKNKSHNTSTCRKKNKDTANKTSTRDDDHHSFAFKMNDENINTEVKPNSFLVDCGATTHIVNNKSCFIHGCYKSLHMEISLSRKSQ